MTSVVEREAKADAAHEAAEVAYAEYTATADAEEKERKWERVQYLQQRATLMRQQLLANQGAFSHCLLSACRLQMPCVNGVAESLWITFIAASSQRFL